MSRKINNDHELLLLKEKNQELVARIRELSLQNREKSSLINVLLESLPFGIVIFDADRQIRQINKMAEQVLKLSRVAAIGKNCSSLFQCYEASRGCPILDAKGVLDRSETIACVSKQDAPTTLLRSVVRAKDLEREILIEAFVDISEIKRAQTEMIEASQMKEDFIAKISHELRTPLNAIIGFSDLIKSELADNNLAPCVDYIAMISTAGEDLLGIVDQILELSKLRAGKLLPDYNDFGLDEFLRDIEFIAKTLAAKNNNTFRIEHESSILLYTDRPRLKQIINNLISNACKFTHDGSVVLKVEHTSNDAIIFSVCDTGVGLTDSEQARIFSPFEQANAKIATRYGGTGLGLAITKHLVELLGGTIQLFSQPGKGSTFQISIPRMANDTAG